MAIISKDEMKGMGAEEINSKIAELKKELIKQNAQIATGITPKSPGKVREMKKTIARLLTKLRTEKSTK